ncbi:molybdopterin cofactor-binding domain-containing protein [Sphingomonas sp. MMS24-JH45]
MLGAAIPRIEGPLKVTGSATYAYEQAPEGTLYAAIVGAPVGAGTVTAIETDAAEALPGVVAVIHDDPRIPAGEANSRAMPHFGTTRIFHHGQPVAIVVAETQAAREAAGLVRVHVEAATGRFDMEAQPVEREHKLGFLPAIDKGDVDAAMASAAVTFDATYTTPVHFPRRAGAACDDDLVGRRRVDAALLEPGDRRGAGYDRQGDEPARRARAGAGALRGWRVRGEDRAGPGAILAAIAAEKLKRPVRSCCHASRSRTSRIIGRRRRSAFASPAPTATGISRRSRTRGARRRTMMARSWSRSRRGRSRSTPGRIAASAPTSSGSTCRPRGQCARRAKAIGTFAIECAMDELAAQLGLDPIELRRRNEPKVDPTSNKPFSTRRMLDCYEEGARRFGWPARLPDPGRSSMASGWSVSAWRRRCAAISRSRRQRR